MLEKYLLVKLETLLNVTHKKNYQILQIHLNASDNSPKSLSQRREFKCLAISKFKDLTIYDKCSTKKENLNNLNAMQSLSLGT